MLVTLICDSGIPLAIIAHTTTAAVLGILWKVNWSLGDGSTKKASDLIEGAKNGPTHSNPPTVYGCQFTTCFRMEQIEK